MTEAETETETEGPPRGDGGVGHAAEFTRERAGAGSSDGVLERIGAFAAREYRVVFRSGWTGGLAVAFALFAVGVVLFSQGQVGPTRPAAVVITLAELAVYLVPLAALALGHSTIVDADDRGALELLFALPVPRRDVVVGATLGRAFALTGALVAGFAAGGVAFVRYAGLAGLAGYVTFAAGAVGVGVAFLGLGVLVSAVAEEKSHALGGALAVWAWFVLVHDLLALGLAVALDLSRGALAVFVLANPVDVFRLFVLAGTGAPYGGTAASLVVDSVGVPVLVAALLGWMVVPVLAAARLVERRTV